MKAAIIVDSTAGLTEETATLSNIYQIYLSTIFEDGTVYIDSPDES
ncbi:MAG: DegV family protein, partial [Ruoffia tabacinasalis]